MRIETGRWNKPLPIPVSERTCKYCNEEAIDNESHFLLKCPTFVNQTRCFLGRLSSFVPDFCYLSDNDKLSTIVCPTSARAAKITNKYIGILFRSRQNIDSGEHISNLTFPPNVELYIEEDPSVLDSSSLDGSDSVCSSSADLSCLSVDSD